MTGGVKPLAPENLKLRRRLELPTAIDQQPTYCQDVNGKCWSNQDFYDKCASYPGTLCLVGTDWSNGANSCGVPLDVVYFVDESPSVSTSEWLQEIDFIISTVTALNGGETGEMVGTEGVTSVPASQKHHIAVIQYGARDEHVISVPFLAGTNLAVFVWELRQLKRQFGTIASSCPTVALHFARKYATYPGIPGFRSNANGGKTIAVMMLDGNPAPASQCAGVVGGTLTPTEERLFNVNFFKESVDRCVVSTTSTRLAYDSRATRTCLAHAWLLCAVE